MRWKTIAAEIERTRTARGRAATGRFSVEGFRLVERALAAGTPIDAVLVSESLGGPRCQNLLEALRSGGVEVIEAPEPAMAQLVDGRETGAIAALLSISGPGSLAELIPKQGRARLLAAVGVDDPGNIGALIRTALAAGADAVVLVGHGDHTHPRAVRVSRGSLFRIPVVRMSTEQALLDALRHNRIETLGAATEHGMAPTELNPADRWCLCLGSEAHGLSQTMLDGLDHLTTIPMADAVDSFSVNAAAAILLHTLCSRLP